MRISAAIGIALALTAPAVQAAPKAPAADANLFVYRAHTDFGWAASLKVDGASLASLGNGAYTATRLAAGEHTLTLGWPMMSGFRSIDTSVTVEPGKTYYFEVRGMDQRYMTGLMVGARIAASLAPTEAAAAPGTIAQCCAFQPPR
jgi:hypothetical protein